jgi:hypothetical protein
MVGALSEGAHFPPDAPSTSPAARHVATMEPEPLFAASSTSINATGPAMRQYFARLAPLYVVVFVGFLGYSLTITVFAPMILRNDNGMLPAATSSGTRSIILGLLLCVYPLGQSIRATRDDEFQYPRRLVRCMKSSAPERGVAGTRQRSRALSM